MEGSNISIEKSKADEYRDIMSYFHLLAASGVVKRYKWNESSLRYEVVYSVEVTFGPNN